MSLQLELISTPPANPATLIRDVISGNVVQMKLSKKVVMKVKPTGFLLNSTVVGDIINRRDVLVVDLSKGTLYTIKGDLECVPLTAKLQYAIKELS